MELVTQLYNAAAHSAATNPLGFWFVGMGISLVIVPLFAIFGLMILWAPVDFLLRYALDTDGKVRRTKRPQSTYSVGYAADWRDEEYCYSVRSRPHGHEWEWHPVDQLYHFVKKTGAISLYRRDDKTYVCYDDDIFDKTDKGTGPAAIFVVACMLISSAVVFMAVGLTPLIIAASSLFVVLYAVRRTVRLGRKYEDVKHLAHTHD